MGMHIGQIIFSNFQGKYEKVKIYIYIYIYTYNFKIVITKKFIKDNLYKKIILNSQWKIVINFPHSKTNFFTMKKFKTICDYSFKENCKTTSVIVIFMIFLKP